MLLSAEAVEPGRRSRWLRARRARGAAGRGRVSPRRRARADRRRVRRPSSRRSRCTRSSGRTCCRTSCSRSGRRHCSSSLCRRCSAAARRSSRSSDRLLHYLSGSSRISSGTSRGSTTSRSAPALAPPSRASHVPRRGYRSLVAGDPRPRPSGAKARYLFAAFVLASPIGLAARARPAPDLLLLRHAPRTWGRGRSSTSSLPA